MSNWIDTVMSDDEIEEVLDRYSLRPDYAPFDIARRQAEISFKLGCEAERKRIRTLLYKLGYTMVAEDMDLFEATTSELKKWGVNEGRSYHSG